VLLLASLPALAQPLESLEAIRGAVQQFLQAQIASSPDESQITVGQLDPRLRLPKCTAPLQTFLPPGYGIGRSTTVGVRCDGDKPWSLYVQASVRSFGKVLVTARPLGRGEVVQAGDIVLKRQELGRLRSGYLTDPAQAVGKRLVRSVNAGTVLSAGLLRAPLMVHRGDRVTIIANTGGLQVRMAGTALEDGAQGQMIRVRNLSSKREVQGVVTGVGIVEVQM
jgi:flagella basal body P-ring formation protein FlgA